MSYRHMRGAALAMAIAASGARAEEPGDAPRYPGAVRLEVADGERATLYRFEPRFQPPILPNPGTQVRVGELAVSAYRTALARMFRPAGADTGMVLSLSLAGEDVDLDSRGWFAYVEHDLALRTPGGEVATWRVRGEAVIRGFGPEAVPAAFAAACAHAAAVFEAEFEARPAAREWLVAQGAELGGVLRARPPRPQPSPAPLLRPRSEQRAFLEIGGAGVVAQGKAGGGGELRAGWSGRYLLVRATCAYWTVKANAQPPGAWGSGRAAITLVAPGLEAGGVLHLSPAVDVVAGVGFHGFLGDTSATYRSLADPSRDTTAHAESSAYPMSLFAGVGVAGLLPRSALRWRLGLEGRHYLGASIEPFQDGSKVRVADLSVLATFGVEIPARLGPAE